MKAIFPTRPQLLLLAFAFFSALPLHALLTQAQAIQAANNALSHYASYSVPTSMAVPNDQPPETVLTDHPFQYSMPDSFDSFGRPVYTTAKPMAAGGFSTTIPAGTYPVLVTPVNSNQWAVGGYGVWAPYGTTGPFTRTYPSAPTTTCMTQLSATTALGNSSTPAVSGDWIMSGPALAYGNSFMANIVPGPGSEPPVLEMVICVHDAGGGMATVQIVPIVEQIRLTNYPTIRANGVFEAPGSYVAAFTVPTTPVSANPPSGSITSPTCVRAGALVAVSFQVIPGS